MNPKLNVRHKNNTRYFIFECWLSKRVFSQLLNYHTFILMCEGLKLNECLTPASFSVLFKYRVLSKQSVSSQQFPGEITFLQAAFCSQWKFYLQHSLHVEERKYSFNQQVTRAFCNKNSVIFTDAFINNLLRLLALLVHLQLREVNMNIL